jgi:hypothetical protein
LLDQGGKIDLHAAALSGAAKLAYEIIEKRNNVFNNNSFNKGA